MAVNVSNRTFYDSYSGFSFLFFFFVLDFDLEKIVFHKSR